MGEAWRRARASSYRQQEDRAREALLRPTLDRFMTTPVAETELICTLRADGDGVSLGAEAILVMRDGANPIVVRGASTLGELDRPSRTLLEDSVSKLGDKARDLSMLPVRVVRVGTFANECAVVLCPTKKDDDAA